MAQVQKKGKATVTVAPSFQLMLPNKLVGGRFKDFVPGKELHVILMYLISLVCILSLIFNSHNKRSLFLNNMISNMFLHLYKGRWQMILNHTGISKSVEYQKFKMDTL